jgi:LPS-assembly protein
MAGLAVRTHIPLLRILSRSHLVRFFAAGLFYWGAVSAAFAQQAPVPPELEGSDKMIVIQSDTQQKDKDVLHLRGHVDIVYQSIHLVADEVSFDESSSEVMARGHVIFDDPKSHLAADEVHYNVQTKQGWFSNGVGYVHPRARPRARVLTTENPFYLSASTADRIDEDTYLLSHGRMTSCECAKRGWSISARQARVIIDDKLVAHDALFTFLGVPLFYTPILVDSIAKEPRQTGFLLPHIGNSSQKGYIVGEGFFWAINRSADLMFGLEDYSKRGLAERGEFRAKPSENADFTVNYFGVNDKDSVVSLRAPGESIHGSGKDDDIGDSFRAVVNVDYVNTMAFRLTWSANYTEAVSSEAVQSGFVSRNWDAYSFNFSAERYEDFLSTEIVPANAVIIRHLPSVDFAGEDKQIGDSPVYYSFEGSADAVGRTEPGVTLPLLEDRLDFHPQLLLRPKEFWHFRFIPTLGFRVTRYGASLLPTNAPIDRLLAEVGFDVRPPSLEKVFSKSLRGYRIKHVIEPDIRYHLVRVNDPTEVLNIVRFDQMDIFAQTNEVEYSLTNTFMARKDVSDNSPDTPQARDIFSWRISQKYYFDPTFGGVLVPGQNNVFAATIDLTGFAFEHGQRLSPIDSVFKFAPFSNYDTEIRTDMNPNGAGGVLDAGITSHVKRGRLGVAFTDFFINRSSYLDEMLGTTTTTTSPSTSLTPEAAYHLLGSLVTYGDPNHKGVSGAFGLDYNFERKEVQHQVSQLRYNFGCFAIDVEYQYYNLGPLRRESQFRVALSLANVGTFGNMKPRERLY